MCRPTRLPYRGRLKWLGELSECYAPLLHRGIGGGMYTRKAHETREAPRRGQRGHGMKDVPRNTGIDADGVVETEADHFMKCPGCGQWFDMRDLGEVLANVHDADGIEIEG